MRGTLANHLWESNAWNEHLEQLTPGLIRSRDSVFHEWARPFVKNFSDNYGSVGAWEQWKRHARHRKHELRSRVSKLLSRISSAVASFFL